MNTAATILLSLTLCVADAPRITVSLAGGRTVEGELIELTHKQLKLTTADGEITQPTSQLLSLAPPVAPAAAPPAGPVRVTLVDGSILPATAYTVAKGIAKVTLAGRDRPLEIPTAAIAHVWLTGDSQAGLAQQWQELVSQEHTSDVLAVVKRDTLDFLEGVLGNLNDTTLDFTLDEELVPVKRTRAAGLIYFHRSDEGAAPVGVIMTADGLQLAALELARDGDNLQVKTPAGVELAVPLAALARIDFSQGKVIYLGELKPESVSWIPYLGPSDLVPAAAAFYQPRVDAAFDGGPLRLDGQTYNRGLALRSRTEVVYRLPDRFGRFTALAGIDDSVRPQGAVHLAIYGDDRLLVEHDIDGRSPAVPVAADLTGVTRLKIIVAYGDDLDVGDQLDLADARIAK